MHPKRKLKLYWILTLVVATAIVVSLVLYALRQNINLYLTPKQLSTTALKPDQLIRVGGLVVKASVYHYPHSVKLKFVITDNKENLTVIYEGILPSLFREGQGIIAEGRLNQSDELVATEVLAKHDEEYRPPNIEK